MKPKITENLLGNKAATECSQPPAKHTLGPGPWFAIPGPHGEPWAIFACEGDKRLFEASRDLLEAAKAVYASFAPYLENGLGPFDVVLFQHLEAAIAKAEKGGEPCG